MLKQILFLLIGIISTSSLCSQSHWKKSDINNFREASSEDKMIMPKAYQAYELEFDNIKEELAKSPTEDLGTRSDKGLLISLPMEDGTFEEFEMFYAPVMAPKLAAKYSTIRSYKGFSTTNRSKNIRLDVGSYGLHAAIHSIEGTVYIDPYARGNVDEYLVYDVKDYTSEVKIDKPLCGSDDVMKDIHFDDVMQTRNADGEIPLRVYRVAIACTGEWGAIRGNVTNAMSDIVTSVNRINQIFENEIAVRLVLIENNDVLLNFNGATDPYLNVSSGLAMLQVNTSVLNNKVGSSAYDLGHVYGRNCDVGGIASLGSLCNSNKGAGVTCHFSNNIDFIAANTTSHEFGHQMSAQHTFNNCDGENESLGNGFEPGSGSTIMSYGGGCGSDRNIFNGSDIYYHVASLIQIYNHTRTEGFADGCAEKIETSNIEPEIKLDYVNGFTIPDRTYFVLEGSATDANDDALTYHWDGFNAGPRSPLGAPIGSAPRFRSFPAGPSPVRFFPSPDDILSGSFDRTEVLPVGDMDLNFMFTARDNNGEAGTAVYQEVKFKTVGTNEKFEVTSQNSSGTKLKIGESLEVTWNVADTDKAPVNTPSVDIYLSSDNAANFSFDNMEILAKELPNTGSATVYMPDLTTFNGRIIVKASNSIYFSISKSSIIVEEPSDPTLFFTPDPAVQSVCLPTSTSVEISTTGFAGIQGDVDLSILSGLPEGASASFSPSTVSVGESSVLTIQYGSDTPSEKFDVVIKANIEGVDDFERNITLLVSSTDHSAMMGTYPAAGAAGVEVAPEFEWTSSANADSYTLEVATTPLFGSSVVISESGLTETSFKLLTILEKSTVYYWRVLPMNRCGEGKASRVRSFITEVLACNVYSPEASSLPIVISQSGLPTITSEVNVSGGSIADVNVTEFVGKHDNNKDLVVTLISPSGTEAEMFRKICNQSDFNCQFDDASNESVKCPLNNGKTYRPRDKFEVFNGEQANGTWTLRIEDTKAGNGGSLNGFALEICSSQAVDSPFLINKNEIILPWNNTRTITSDDLKVEDNNNSASELKYTIVYLPSNGQLKLNNSNLNVGAQFTQADIDNGNITYTSAGANYKTSFSFTVIDGEGGFLGINDLDIEVSDPNSTFDLEAANEITVYPIPTKDRLTIDLSASSEVFDNYQIVDIKGRILATQTINSEVIELDLSQLPSGIYIINIINDRLSIPKRIIVE